MDINLFKIKLIYKIKKSQFMVDFQWFLGDFKKKKTIGFILFSPYLSDKKFKRLHIYHNSFLN